LFRCPPASLAPLACPIWRWSKLLWPLHLCIHCRCPLSLPQARAEALKAELLNSRRLAGYFEERPRDAALLRHDKPLAATTAAAGGTHLTHMPAYIRDPTLVTGRSSVGNTGEQQSGEVGAVDPPRRRQGIPREGSRGSAA
jgi:hypothetical protein